jgi:capsular exopolysaccharide synthesis family protein
MAQFLTEEEKFRQMMQSPDSGEEDQSPLDSIDFEKILHILRKNWYWLLIIPTLFLSSAYLYLRYTKPLFQSTSNLKMEIKDESIGLIVQNPVISTNNQDNIAGELEVIRSPIIFDEVAKKLDLSVSYFAEGRILDNEMYGFSPIVVKTNAINERLYGSKFYISTENGRDFTLRRKVNGGFLEEYKGVFDQPLKNPDLDIVVSLKKDLSSYSENIFFVPNSKNSVMGYLSNNLEAAIINPQAKIIGISFKDFNASKARDILHTISEVYRNKTVEIKNRANKQKKEYLDSQIDKTEKELNFYEAQMEKFIIENKTNNIEGKIGELVSKIQQLTEERIKLNVKLQSIIELQMYVQQRASIDSKNIPIMPEIDAGIMQQLIDLNKLKAIRQEQELSESASTYGSQKLALQIGNLQKMINESIERNKTKLLKDMTEIGVKLAEIEQAFYGLPSKITEFNKLRKKYETVQTYYNSLIQQKIQIDLAEAGTVPSFEVIAPANTPVMPISPKKTIIYIIAGIAGTILGLLVIVGKYLLKNTIGSQAELEKLVSLPIMGSVPKYKKEKLEVSKLIVHKNPKSAVSESFRNIRTNLDFMFSHNEKDKRKTPQKVISVTSTISGEGKTFITINLGGIIAMSGLRVVILDLDMRKPKVHLGLNGTNEKGISTILIGRHSLEECLRTTDIENLAYIAAGPIPPNPSELILRDDFSELIKNLQDIYDVILIDTPPVGLVTDAMIIMQQVDVRFFVMRANYSKRGFAKNIQRIAKAHQIPRIGLILNSIESKGSYGYGYGYGYGYDGYYEEENKNNEKWGFMQTLKDKILRKK